MKNVFILDLFSGAGGFSLGFHMAGFKPGVMIDSCTYATETLKANFGHLGGHILKEDLSKLTPARLQTYLKSNRITNSIDLIIGGPPCQGWSMAGRAKLRSLGRDQDHFFNDERNVLVKNYIRFISHFRPQAFLMENVPGIKSYFGFNVLEYIIASFRRVGYEVSAEVLNSSHYGVPQRRERVFLVGIRKDLGLKFEFPKPNGCKVTLRDAISDLPIVRDGSKTEIKDYKKTSSEISEYARIMREGASRSLIYDHICTKHRPDDVEAFKLLKEGGYYRDLPKKLKRYRDDTFFDKYTKLKWSEPSKTITAHLSKDCYSHIHPSQARTITVREAARIQSFPDRYYFHGGMCSKFKLIGNAVPPLMGKLLAEEIKKQVFSGSKRFRDRSPTTI